jgi:hypothetical protein
MQSSSPPRCPNCGGTCSRAERPHVKRLSQLADDAMRLATALGRCLDAAVIAGIGALFQMAKGWRFNCEQCDHKFAGFDDEQTSDENRDRPTR